MKRIVLAAAMGVVAGFAANVVWATGPQEAAPTSQEIHQKALAEGPATGRIGYLTHPEPVAAAPAPRRPVDPRMLKPLTQREVGMLYHACVAYPECKTAYAQAYEHNQALLRAKAEGEAAQ